MSIDFSIFKACDIRGVYGETFTADAARLIGQAIGTDVDGAEIVIGGDVRTSTPVLKQAVVEGLVATGCRVTDIGTVPTPALYFAKRYHSFDHALMVTASHNPPQYNGVKLMLHNVPTVPVTMERLTDCIKGGGFTPSRGSSQWREINAAYQDWLIDFFKDRFARSLTILVDAGNGSYGQIAPAVLRRLGHTVIELNCELDGTFPNRDPNPAVFKHLTAACEAVTAASADVGFAFDGDGDRVIVIDETGCPMAADRMAILLIRNLFRSASGFSVVYDLKSTEFVRREVKALGGHAVMERSGHSFIRCRMMADDAAFGTEVSGHLFFKELDYGDDGLYAASHVAGIVAAADRPLSILMAEIPVPVITPDMRIKLDPEQRDEVLEAFRQAFTDCPTSDVDGIRVSWPDGWALCRHSVTEPVVTLRFEADNREKLQRIVKEVGDAVPELREEIERQVKGFGTW